MSVNHVILVGNVGKDPEVNSSVSSFSLATSETYKNKAGEKVTNTEWHNVVCFGQLADIVAKHVKKGSHIYLEGKIKYESYEKDGVKKYSTKIIANQIKFIGAKSESNQSSEVSNDYQKHDEDYIEPDNLPF